VAKIGEECRAAGVGVKITSDDFAYNV